MRRKGKGPGALARLLASASWVAAAASPSSAEPARVPPRPAEIRVVDVEGRRVRPERSRLSLGSGLPRARVEQDPAAFRVLVLGQPGEGPARLELASVGPDGEPVDLPRTLALEPFPCPAGVPRGGDALVCRATRALVLLADELDRAHPAWKGAAILARLGGTLVVRGASGERPQAYRVGGPRGSSPVEATLRVFVLRARRGGPPALGGSDEEAKAVAAREVERARRLWAPCGIGLRVAPPGISVLDPPSAERVTLGEGLGLPASGGTLRLLVDGREVALALRPGTAPPAAGRALARAIGAAGFSAELSEIAAAGAAAGASVDVIVRRGNGEPARLETPAGGRLTDDATLSARLGDSRLHAGLRHFGDADGTSGTAEERALALAHGIDDGDPSTIEVLFVPAFSGGKRIGEAFIGADRGPITGAVILDRAAVRAGAASSTLAHELGHVLLDEPGHPDDFGDDLPTRLMDGDAAELGVFGPRRLSRAECARALGQRGPGAAVPLLVPSFAPPVRPAPYSESRPGWSP